MAELTTGTANDCSICLSPVHERTDELKTQIDTDTMGSMPCGHHTSLCNDCFITLVMSKLAHTVVPCPLCRASLTLTPRVNKRIENKLLQQFLVETEEMERLHGVHIDDIVQRWPKILEIGNMQFLCSNELRVSLLFCAYHVIIYPDMEDAVTETMKAYAQHPALAVQAITKATWSSLYEFRHARIYDYYGTLITIGQAVTLSLNYVRSEAIEQTLMEMESELTKVYNTDVDEALLAYPELLPFQHENIEVDGVHLEFSIRRAVLLTQVSMFNTNSIKDTLVALNQGFLAAETMVDNYIAENWPHLVPFQNIGRLTNNAEPHTIREFAKMVHNPAMTFRRATIHLNFLEDSIATSSQNFEQMVDSFSVSVQEAQSNYLEHIPGGRISVYTALLYSTNPVLSPEERAAWTNEIAEAMKVLRNNRASSRAIQPDLEAGRIEEAMPRAPPKIAQSSVVQSSNSNLASRRNSYFRIDNGGSSNSENVAIRISDRARNIVEHSYSQIANFFSRRSQHM